MGLPPSFGPGGAEVATVAGADDIEESLRILLSTRPGERVMRESFGCDLGGLLFEEVDQSLVNTVTRLVTDSIVYHEPRIRLDRLDVTPSDAESGLLLISIHYTIRGTNSRFNLVYPFYVLESTVPEA